MNKNRDYLAVVTIMLLVVSSLAGIMSLNFNHSYEFINQYGQSVQIYGYGMYANDTYFQAPISIGTDFCILIILIPVFLYTYRNYRKKETVITQLKLISIYAVALYYAASITFGLTYNKLFLVYVILFGCCLFGMFCQIARIKISDNLVREPSKGETVFLCLSGIALIVAWFPDIIPTIITGAPLSYIGVYHTCITYILDMGIIAPLCIICIYLLKKKSYLGLIIESAILKLCMFVGILMFPQMICQIASGCDLPILALVTKSFSFILLGGFAAYFNARLYRRINGILS